jgi:hypothetical protein
MGWRRSGLIGSDLIGFWPAPRHEFVDAALRPSLDEASEEVGEVPLRIDTVELARLDQRGDGGPGFRPLVAAGGSTG